MPADLQPVVAGADMVGVVDDPCRQPEQLALDLAQRDQVCRFAHACLPKLCRLPRMRLWRGFSCLIALKLEPYRAKSTAFSQFRAKKCLTRSLIRSTARFSAPCNPTGGSRSASRSEEHTSELQSLMRISYAVFCLKKTKTTQIH